MRKLKILALLTVLLLILCGCGMSDDDYPQAGNATVLILNNCANSNRYDEEVIQETLHDLLMDSIERTIDSDDRYCVELNVDVLISDGKPTREPLVLNGEPLLMTDDATYAEKAIQRAEYLVEDFEAFLLSDELRAKDDGTNLLAALEEAARILNATSGKEKHIYIYSSGVETEGALAMGTGENQIDIQKGEVEDVIRQIGEGALPDLKGIHIHFYGLGDVCVGQKDMRSDTKKPGDISNFEERFVDVWTAVFEECNVTKEYLNGGSGLYMAPKGDTPMVWETGAYPEVRNVPFYEIIQVQDTGDDSEVSTPSGALNLSSSELGGFVGDGGDFKDVAKAKAALMSYYEYALKAVENDPELKLYVIGSRAKTHLNSEWDSTHTNQIVLMDHKTSEVRALTVSNLILELFDISADQIIEIDAGTQRFSWSSPTEEFPGGKYFNRDDLPKDERDAYDARQAEHRVVTLIPATANNESLIAELAHESDIRP